MSQYPQGYPPQYSYPMPGYPQWPAADPAAPAKRAGILMIILGVVALLLAGCMGMGGALVPKMQNNPEIAQAVAKMEQQAGISAATVFIVGAVMIGQSMSEDT